MTKKFQSAEHMAMQDIAEYVKEQAQDIVTLYNTTNDSMYDFWDPNICMVIAQMFIGATAVCCKKSRELNRELGLHKVNK